MYNEITEMIRSLIVQMERTKSWSQRRLEQNKQYAKYYLETSKHKSAVYFYRREYGDKTGATRKYLGTLQSEEVLRIMEVVILKRRIRLLDKNIRAATQFLNGYKASDPQTVLNGLPQIYRALPPGRCFQVKKPVNVEEWRNNLLELKKVHPPKYPEELTLTCDDGTVVRTKSEQVIANMLYSLGIPYVYEAPLKVGDIWIHPDFTIYIECRNRVYYIEHMGFFASEEYADRNEPRLSEYIRAGILPDEKLILSFEGTGGRAFNSRILRRKLERLLAGKPLA